MCLRHCTVFSKQWNQEGQYSNEVRSVFKKPLSLVKILVDQSKLTLLEVSQTTMDHFRRFGGSARGDIATIDEGNSKSSVSSIDSHSGPRHTRSNNHNIEGFVAKAFERGGAMEGIHPSMLAQPPSGKDSRKLR